ncbi:hypothetical protein [Actinoplanes utahensis]|uniref:Uncharacterized protein n=1 Tax=Actinoplanes utahensis TaxID=1869 RepID=A0A0A6XDJ4_ACTUT|nr:hypothetical protein [Actinoplanes utahensis]KHD78162.1 hypothetical protein MB27_06800 [Actinoplanes utahensis]GIF30658.1 hypothetical protein Aut01nite_36440 [Actinoplanes utahensis]
MPTTDLHLVVDIAAWWTTAAYESGDDVQPVLFDGRARTPSGVFHDDGVYHAGTAALTQGIARPEDYRPDPMTLLRHGGPAEAVAAVLTHVAARTGGATALTVITAQSWDLPARQRLEKAADIARLPRPRVVTAAAAVASLTGEDVAVVCVPGPAWPELTLVDARDGQQRLTAATVRAPGAAAVDEALLRVAAVRAGADADADDWRLLWEIERARSVLAVQPRAAVLLPEPHQAVVVAREDLAAATAVHLDRLADTVKQLLDDADLTPPDIGAVVLVGDDDQMAAALTGAGLAPTRTVRDPHAILRSAARTRPPGRPSWPWRRR